MRSVLVWLIPVALLFILRGKSIHNRQQQLSQAINDISLDTAVSLEKVVEPKDIETDLLLQILKGNTAGMEALIAQGASVNHNRDWGSPLMHAVASKNIKTVKILVKHGADVNFKQKTEEGVEGSTPLRWAAQCRCPDIAKFLIEHGANVHMGRGGQTILDDARNSDYGQEGDNQIKTIQVLKAAGAKGRISRPLPFEK
jgi:ankyrin repeat protein